MYASVGTNVPVGPNWTFEPKYDGIRILAGVSPSAVHLITRNGNDKALQFPEIALALQKFAAKRKVTLLLDGEIIAMHDGNIKRFQELQSRMGLDNVESISKAMKATQASYAIFDILVDDHESVIELPWSKRRAMLEARIGKRSPANLLIAPTSRNNGKAMLAQAKRLGWEGLIAKNVEAHYEPGVRTKNWLKLKIEHRQEFVIGGYTEPRNSRQFIGALLLGYFNKAGDLVYVGHTGGGFSRQGLADMHAKLERLARKRSPFSTEIQTNEAAHWVAPKIVVEVKFNEWTTNGHLRQPIFLGIRDDKDARDVGKEAESVQEQHQNR